MKYRTLDANGDFTFGSRLFLTRHQAVAQAILTRLRLLLAEWWEDMSDGLPLFENILGAYGGERARAAADLLISERILNTTGVNRVLTYESRFEANTRQYLAECEVDTVYGLLPLEITGTTYGLEVRSVGIL